MIKLDVKEKRFPRWDNVDIDHKYVNFSDVLKVTLINSPAIDDTVKTIGSMVLSTWDRTPFDTLQHLDFQSLTRLTYRALQGKFLPSALESWRISFLVEGLTAHDLTHILRSRAFAFASDCTGDRVNNYRPIVIPSFLQDMGNDYVIRFKKANDELMCLYKEAMEHKDVNGNHDISNLDTRLLLPRTATQFLYFSCSIGDALSFIRSRLDRQIQPGFSDNMLAIMMLHALSEKYYFISTLIDINGKNNFYISESNTNFGSHYFKPLPQNEKQIAHSNEHFLYKDKARNDLLGQQEFVKMWNYYEGEINTLKDISHTAFPYLYDEEFLNDWK